MYEFIIGAFALAIGGCVGYYTRQAIAYKRAGTIEKNIANKIAKAKLEAQKIADEATQKSQKLLESSRLEVLQRNRDITKTEALIFKREAVLEQKVTEFEAQEKEFQEKIKKLKSLKENLEELHSQAVANLERVANLTKAEARQELLNALEKEYQKDLLDKTREMESLGQEPFRKRAKEILVGAIQKFALSQAQEVTTSVVNLPNDEIKGRIIGKEGRNIRTLERLTGVEVIVDETP